MNLLKELRINQEGILPSFNKDIFDYYLTINEDIDSLEIEAMPENANSKVEIIGNNGFKEGENNVVIKVISDKEETVYNIQIVKTKNIEMSNCNLEILEIENELIEPVFDANITDYKIDVSNDITNLNILAIAENENAKVEITGNNELEIGDNLIEVTVTSQDKTAQKKYNIIAYRKTKKETNEYIEKQEKNEQKLQELLIQTNSDYEYDAEKTSLKVTQYKSNNEVIKLGTLLSILFVILMILVIFKSRKH